MVSPVETCAPTSTSQVNPASCQLCGGTLHTRFATVHDTGTGDSFSVEACGSCGLGQTRPVPSDWGRYYPPAYYPPAYYDPSMSYAPPSGTVSFAPDPSQKIVQFPTGRYEMRGDGVSSPYTWVWIPNPPTSPPPAAPTEPPAAPTAQPAAEPGSSSPPSAARISRLYRWTDEQGSVHWTDRLDAVPEQYRSRVKQTSPS